MGLAELPQRSSSSRSSSSWICRELCFCFGGDSGAARDQLKNVQQVLKPLTAPHLHPCCHSLRQVSRPGVI